MAMHVLVCRHDTMRVAGCQQAILYVFIYQRRNCGDGGGGGWGLHGGGGVEEGEGGWQGCVREENAARMTGQDWMTGWGLWMTGYCYSAAAWGYAGRIAIQTTNHPAIFLTSSQSGYKPSSHLSYQQSKWVQTMAAIFITSSQRGYKPWQPSFLLAAKWGTNHGSHLSNYVAVKGVQAMAAIFLTSSQR